MILQILLIACAVSAGSGLPGLILSRRRLAGQYIAVAMLASASIVGVGSATLGLVRRASESIEFTGVLPDLQFHFRLDPLSAFFLAPIFLLGAASSIYGLRYWQQSEHLRTGRWLSLFFGLLLSGLALVTLAGDGVTFLFAWEIMALSAFLLVGTEDHKADARRASWIYLLATHVGTLTLFALFALLRAMAGTFELRRLDSTQAGSGIQAVIFLLALVGFGIKAGAMPLHFWLPGAHAAAPSHVSAILSGVLLKIGIYGLLRTITLLPNLPGICGILVLIVGVVSAVFGVVFALGQHDLKRLLAYHSIENIGIILMGMGLGMIGAASGHVEWMVLGFAGCLLHVWNHCLFKSLLFLGAGCVVHSTGTRQIDQLGGLAKRMPRTAMLFSLGAIAICGLPPLNGFVSELLIYLGLFRIAAGATAGIISVALAAPALAMVGALAVACFVKAYGAVFLGTPRTPRADHAHDAPAAMIAPMIVLAGLCIGIGVLPILVLPLLDRVIAMMNGGPAALRLADLVPYLSITILSVALLLAIAIAILLLQTESLLRRAERVLTWDCGYIQSRPTIQYTSSSFASTLVRLFRWVLRPQVHRTQPVGLFPDHAAYESHVPDIILDETLSPFWARVKSRLASARVLQQGPVQRYLLYILLALFGLLLSLVPVTDWAQKLLGR
jgi:hydrogenase-4 component B